MSLARTYNVGYESLRRANPGVDPWLPGEGTQDRHPDSIRAAARAAARHRRQRRGAAALLLSGRVRTAAPEGAPAGSRRVITHPISIGKHGLVDAARHDERHGQGREPELDAAAIDPRRACRSQRHLAARRSGRPRQSARQARAAPRLPGYLIHGTNKPSGVGMRVTHGCIRMFPEDIEALYKTVPAGTAVTIVNQPYKLGWTADGLYLEAHPQLAKFVPADTQEIDEPSVADTAEPEPVLVEGSLTELTRAYVAATESRTADVRWDFAETVLLAARGVPEFISVAARCPRGRVFQLPTRQSRRSSLLPFAVSDVRFFDKTLTQKKAANVLAASIRLGCGACAAPDEI